MLAEALRWFGFGLCHQIPERTLAAGGVQMPVCARDMGIYLGFVTSFIVLALTHRRERPRGLPPAHAWVMMALLVAAMVWDGITSYASLRSTTNLVRFVTGVGAGWAIAPAVLAMVNDTVWRDPGRGRVLGRPGRFAVWVAALPVSTALLWLGGPLLGAALALLVVAAILCTLAAINLVIVGMVPRFDRAAARAGDLAPAIALAVVLAIVEVVMAGVLKALLVGAVGAV